MLATLFLVAQAIILAGGQSSRHPEQGGLLWAAVEREVWGAPEANPTASCQRDSF